MHTIYHSPRRHQLQRYDRGNRCDFIQTFRNQSALKINKMEMSKIEGRDIVAFWRRLLAATRMLGRKRENDGIGGTNGRFDRDSCLH